MPIMRVFCVDDESLMLRMLISSVKKIFPQAEIFDFGGAQDVLDFAENSSADIAFIDVHIWDMRGTELAKRLKQKFPNINIVFVTGSSDEGFSSEVEVLGNYGFIMKPVTPDKILKELKNLDLQLEDGNSVL